MDEGIDKRKRAELREGLQRRFKESGLIDLSELGEKEAKLLERNEGPKFVRYWSGSNNDNPALWKQPIKNRAPKGSIVVDCGETICKPCNAQGLQKYEHLASVQYWKLRK